MKVAALFVDPRGVYTSVDPWLEIWGGGPERDARNYHGPYPVVAHPPCARWCQLAPLVQAVHGYRIGDDDGCFTAALDAVRRWGGVLEHPAYSLAWDAYGLPKPTRYGWAGSLTDPGFATEIDQAAYGHPCRKRTWLYAYGVELPAMDWREVIGASMVSDLGPGGTRRRGDDWQHGVQYAEASATPPRLATELVALARTATVATPDNAPA